MSKRNSTLGIAIVGIMAILAVGLASYSLFWLSPTSSSSTPDTIARFGRNTDTSVLAENTDIVIDFNYEANDPGNNFNLATDTYTVPVSGNYLIVGSIDFNNGDDGDIVWIKIKVNSIEITSQSGTFAESGATAYATVNFNTLLALNAGDLVTIIARLVGANTGAIVIHGSSVHSTASIAKV